MTPAMVIFVLLLPYTQTISLDQDLLMNKLKDSLDILCPGVDICSPSKSLSRNVIFKSNFISCCRACSCADDCLEGTCCFNDTDSSNSADTIRKCQYPFDLKGKSSRPYAQKYYIIDSIPEDGCGSTEQSCNVTPPYPWGQMLPVISTKTNLIYKNPDCAQCHGLQEDEYEMWNSKFGCEKDDQFGTIFEPLEDMIRTKKLSSKCAIMFSYTGKRAYAASQNCYSQLRMNCKDDFKIPNELNMTREEVIHACKHGPRSPFSTVYNKEPFFNIYCYLCADGSTRSLLCKEVENEKNPIPIDFATLLSLESIEELVSSKPESVSKPVACIQGDEISRTELNTTECRELLCPLGRIRDADGNCIFITKTWQDVTYILLLDLELDESISSLISPQTEQVPELILQIIASLNVPSKWNNNFISRVYPCDESDLSNNPSFTIGFFVDAASHYDTILATAADIVGRSWIFERNGLKLPFRFTFNKHSFFHTHQHTPLILTPLIPSPDKTIFTKMCYKMLKYEVSHSSLAAFQIKKIFLCDQIYITPSEYRLHADRMRPNNILQYRNHTLFSAEFALEKKGTDEELARICLEDSGFHRYTRPLKSNELHLKPGPPIYFTTAMLYFTFCV